MRPVMQARRVLVISTSMGAGHNGNGSEMLRRVRAGGDQGLMIDQLDLLPLRIGHAVRRWYRIQLRFIPASYERSWRSMNRIHGLLAFLNGVLCWRRLKAILDVAEPDLLVANNPLAAQMLGYLKTRQKLRVPAVTFITDFGVHELWVHRAIDANFCVHESAAREVRRLGGQAASAPGPLVGPAFFETSTRAAARSKLPVLANVDANVGIVVLTSGSWGVGEIEATARELANTGSHVVVPCGRDDGLRCRLADTPGITALGWTDDMATVLAAADVVVENAGGLSAMEAFASRRPVITYRPLPGHGRHNAETMEGARVTTYARTPTQLTDAIRTSMGKPDNGNLEPGTLESDRVFSSVFVHDATEAILDLANVGASVLIGTPTPRPTRSRPLVFAGVGTLLYSLATGGVHMAVAAGVPLAPRMKAASNEVVVAMRLNAAELASSHVQDAVAHNRLAVVVDDRTADASSVALHQLVADNVALASGEETAVHSFMRDRLRHRESKEATRDWLKSNRSAYIVEGHADVFDVARARQTRTPLVVGARFRPGNTLTGQGIDSDQILRGGHLYIKDERTATPSAVVADIEQLVRTARRQRLTLVRLAEPQTAGAIRNVG